MRTAFITRNTLYDVPGGDTVQVLQTARHLQETGMVETAVLSTAGRIDYERYDLFHFFNITRPADMLYHINRIKKPFVITPVLIDYSEYDLYHRKGMAAAAMRHLPVSNEYIKTVGRWITGKDGLRSPSFLWKGQRKSIQQALKKATMVLPNSMEEYERLTECYGISKAYDIIPNGIDTSLFVADRQTPKDPLLVVCAARIEGIKNQLNLIRALNGTEFKLVLIGSAAPNQRRYYNECRRIAAANIVFHERVPQYRLPEYYRAARVHALPSWFETCGLSSLEAAAMGCNIVITDKGYTRAYFGDHAFYCNPADPASIREAVVKAAAAGDDHTLRQQVTGQYTWQRAAGLTLQAYKKIV